MGQIPLERARLREKEYLILRLTQESMYTYVYSIQCQFQNSSHARRRTGIHQSWAAVLCTSRGSAKDNVIGGIKR